MKKNETVEAWFECKVIYDKTMENGMKKTVTELYLVQSCDFNSAESRIIEEIAPFISGEFIVSSIRRVKLSKLFPSQEEAAYKWYKGKLLFITLDEKSGAEKKTAAMMLVQADDLRNAVKNLEEGMKGTMADYQIASVSEINIFDVYFLKIEENESN